VSESATRVAVVDDDRSLCSVLAAALRHHGFEVSTYDSGSALIADLSDPAGRTGGPRPSVIVLDVMMPGIDGWDTAATLRASGDDTPVLFLSALDTPADKLRGLTGGGDDYITKPFDLDELVARVRIALRRTGARSLGDLPPGPSDSAVLRYADLVLDEERHRVRRHGRPIELTSTEFRLLRYLLTNAEIVVSKQQILDAVWQYDFDGDASVVETYVYYLRRKLDVHTPKLIQTIRGAGYSLRLPDQ
jgi:two-component system, OmpR family, response regulator